MTHPPPGLPEVDAAALREGALILGVALSDEQVQQFGAYAHLLMKWNKVHNITAISSTKEVITHHFLDSLALVPPLQRMGLRPARILDVGSGGGLPGLPLAIACPDLSITLLDAVQKKTAFLTQVRLELRLANVDIVHARVEQWRAPLFDAIVARAFASLRDLVALTRHLLRAEGVWLAMKGPGLAPELADLPVGLAAAEVLTLAVPGLDETRKLVVLRPLRAGG